MLRRRPQSLALALLLVLAVAACSAPTARAFATAVEDAASAPAAAIATAHDRVHTTRAGKHLLTVPKEDDAFGFVVYGDRTGGTKEGIAVLRDAVRDTNLIDPDLVFTVGDLVNGYNGDAQWKEQASEYREAMSHLRMPWFPVAGNHDVYWRGEGKPSGEHEHNFETAFGPLWYALEHKNCLFLALYSDEGDPATGKKDFGDPLCQRMSEVQFEWLRTTLQQHKDKRHIFVFLHHPRWLPARYPGADWDRVHQVLAQNGNVTAVFAGHIHRMRFDGVRDGIQYYTLAAVGAYLDLPLPQVGFLHEFHVVTVRDEGIQLAALPVGAVMDPKAITGAMSDDVEALHARLRPENARGLAFGTDGSATGEILVDFHNPASQPIELVLLPEGDDSWSFGEDHTHLQLAAGARATATIAARRRSSDATVAPTMPLVVLRTDYLCNGLRIALPEVRAELSLQPTDLVGPADAKNGSVALDGDNGTSLRVEHGLLQVPDGPLTVEAWVRADQQKGRRAVVAKTEGSEYALTLSDGKPHFAIRLGNAYVAARAPAALSQEAQWHHLAGVYDGSEVRLYIDGALAAKTPGAGTRTTNTLPLFVGADPNGKGQPTSCFCGAIDELRISTTARYAGTNFDAPLRHEPDGATALLLHFDVDLGAWSPDSSGKGAHARRLGRARCVAAPAAK